MQVAGFTGSPFEDLLTPPISAGKDNKSDISRKLVFIDIFLVHQADTHPLL